MIYLDNSATTYPKPSSVYEALDFANRNLAFNAGRGSYDSSKEAAKIIDQCRASILSFVKNKSDVAFLSSATESLNLIINGLNLEKGSIVYVSPFEHNAIIRPLKNLEQKYGIEIIQIPFDKISWKPNLSKLEEMFSIKHPSAVFLSHISNVTGLILDYEDVFKLSKEFNAINTLDCAQSFGVLKPNLDNVDFCVFAGHKSLYASFGIAGIISNNFSLLSVTKSGGTGSDSLNHLMPLSGHERLESGSPNIVSIYGLLKSSEWLKNANILEKEKELTKYLIESLSQLNKVILYLPDNLDSILGIVSFNIDGYVSDDIANILEEEYQIAVRSGYHCSPLVHEFIDSIQYKGTVRVSLGAFNTKDDVDKLITALKTF